MNNHNKGKAWEMAVAKVTRHALDKAAKRNKSSHRGVRRSDIYTELPLHIEAKDHETIKVKEWFRQASRAAGLTKTPVVVFRQDEEMMAVVRYTDLLGLMVQIAELEDENADLRTPQLKSDFLVEPELEPDTFVNEEDVRVCRAGHLADVYGYCLQKDCKFSRTYKLKKEKKR